MNIARVLLGLGALVMLVACAAQRPEAPAPSPNSGNFAAPEADEAAPAPPGAAPAPQGLEQRKAEESPAKDKELEFATVEAAERALNQAKSDLDRLALAEPSPVQSRRAADGAEKKSAPRAQAPSPAGAAASAAPNPQCEDACRAFASLSRAASAVCRLDGDSGAHCGRAKRMVSDSERRVSSCVCQPPGQ